MKGKVPEGNQKCSSRDYKSDKKARQAFRDMEKAQRSGQKLTPGTTSPQANPNPEQGPDSLPCCEGRGEAAAGEESEAGRGRLMRFKEGSRLRNRTVRADTAGAGGGAAAGYPDRAKSIRGGGYTAQVFNADVQSYTGGRCHLGRSQPHRSQRLVSKLQKLKGLTQLVTLSRTSAALCSAN